MTIRRRVEKLEEAQGGGDGLQADRIVLRWPEDQDHRIAKPQPWPYKPGEKVRLFWPDGSEVGPL
jgi:hypothetical protein